MKTEDKRIILRALQFLISFDPKKLRLVGEKCRLSSKITL